MGEVEAHSTRESRNRDHHFRGAFIWRPADGQGVLVVVNQLDRRGKPLSQCNPRAPNEFRRRRIEPRDERVAQFVRGGATLDNLSADRHERSSP